MKTGLKLFQLQIKMVVLLKSFQGVFQQEDEHTTGTFSLFFFILRIFESCPVRLYLKEN